MIFDLALLYKIVYIFWIYCIRIESFVKIGIMIIF